MDIPEHDYEKLAIEFTMRLSMNSFDGTASDLVQRYFSLYPEVCQQIEIERRRIDQPDLEREPANAQPERPEDQEYYLDPELPTAMRIAFREGRASVSMLQRRLHLGYARTGRLIDEMERIGIISKADGAKPRDVIVSEQKIEELIDRLF